MNEDAITCVATFFLNCLTDLRNVDLKSDSHATVQFVAWSELVQTNVQLSIDRALLSRSQRVCQQILLQALRR